MLIRRRRDFLYSSAIPFEPLLQHKALFFGVFNYNTDDKNCAAIKVCC